MKKRCVGRYFIYLLDKQTTIFQSQFKSIVFSVIITLHLLLSKSDIAVVLLTKPTKYILGGLESSSAEASESSKSTSKTSAESSESSAPVVEVVLLAECPGAHVLSGSEAAAAEPAEAEPELRPRLGGGGQQQQQHSDPHLYLNLVHGSNLSVPPPDGCL